jgi:zinc transport system substrate-binding protein
MDIGFKRRNRFVRKSLVLLVAVLVLGLAVNALLGGCTAENNSKIKVVTSTSLMEYIVRQVGGDLVDVINLIPPNQHPGNFDVKPGDIQTLSSAKLFLLHGWPGETYADKLVASANNPDLSVVKASVDGNWMIPSVQAAATDKVMGILSEVDQKHASQYAGSAEAYKKRIQSREADIKTELDKADISGVKVIASARQADFLQWAGFDVIATFSGPQALTLQTIKELVDQGRTAGVSLVVNNLQDGKDAGIAVAEELGVKNLNLSNFPGGLDDTGTWEKAIDKNVALLLSALGK